MTIEKDSIAALKALAAGAFHCVRALGFYEPGDGGGGEFYWDAVSTEFATAGRSSHLRRIRHRVAGND
jgi:hypothetical protein